MEKLLDVGLEYLEFVFHFVEDGNILAAQGQQLALLEPLPEPEIYNQFQYCYYLQKCIEYSCILSVLYKQRLNNECTLAEEAQI